MKKKRRKYEDIYSDWKRSADILAFQFGFWNVRTMSQLSKTEQVLKEMSQYDLDILTLSKEQLPG